MESIANIEIKLDQVKEGLRLWIDACRPDSLFDAEENAGENNEARFQLVEGCYYDYQLSDSDFILGDVGENIIQKHKRTPNIGTIAPNIFVGTLSIPILAKATSEEQSTIQLEVQSVKAGYRDDYRDMLELITEKCTDLLLQANSPVAQHFETDYAKDSQTVYQKFAFIKSVIGTDEFAEAVHRIVTAPVTKWTEIYERKDIRSARRFSNTNIKEFLKGGNRTKLPDAHYLKNYGFDSLPERITTIRKTDSVDTPENRFVKHALEAFLKFCTDINIKAKDFGHQKMKNESALLIRELESQLHHSVFKDISRPTTLKLNSPVLQRKEGYREVLRVWLMFDLAAKLIWTGGDDIYDGGKKDIATLYEYWLFFKLLDLLQTLFEIEPKGISDLIKETPDGLNLQIKQGKFTALQGVYDSGNRKLNIRFNYNRPFSGKKNYPDSGSWTTTLRPDYTLSFWPFGISETEAERQELIVHVHFDAKYKIANLADFFGKNADNDLDGEKVDNRKGIYTNADLLKMHAYKDAIRRTGGAYVLYPGDNSINRKGFHEIIPGLGAFPVRPSKIDSGIGELKSFILEIIDHFINRASQREKLAYRIFDIHKNRPDFESEVRTLLPEPYNMDRGLIPDETFVLVGYCKYPKNMDWYKSKGMYNFRMDDDKGSINLESNVVNAKYLLLRERGKETADKVFRIKSSGPKVIQGSILLAQGYHSEKIQEYYLVIEIETTESKDFDTVSFNFKELAKYKEIKTKNQPYTAAGIPFAVSLTELMKAKVK